MARGLWKITPEQRRAALAAKAKKRRDDRRARDECYQCGVSIKGAKGPLCKGCKKKRAEARERFEAAHPNRQRHPRRHRKPSAARMQITNVRRRERRWQAKVIGRCVHDYCMENALEDSLFCAPHTETHRRATREYHRRRNWPTILGMNIWRAASEPLRSKKSRKLVGIYAWTFRKRYAGVMALRNALRDFVTPCNALRSVLDHGERPGDSQAAIGVLAMGLGELATHLHGRCLGERDRGGVLPARHDQ